MADINNINSRADLIEVINNYVKTPKIPALTGAQLNILMNKMIQYVPTEVENALNFNDPGKVLDARQGKALKDLIDNVSIGMDNVKPSDSPSIGAKIVSASTVGTYTNFSGIEVTSTDLNNGLVQLRLVGATWEKIIIPIPLGGILKQTGNGAPIEVQTPLKVLISGNIDSLRGPYSSILVANTAIPNTMIGGESFRKGKFVEIGSGSLYKTYWWRGTDYADDKLVEYFADLTPKDTVLSKTLNLGVVDALSTYTTTVANSVTRWNSTPISEDIYVTSISFWVRRAGTISIRFVQNNSGGTVQTYNTLSFTAVVGANTFTSAAGHFTTFIAKSGTFIGAYAGTSTGALGAKTKTNGSYSYAGSLGTVPQASSGLSNLELGITITGTTIAINSELTRVAGIIESTADPVAKKSLFTVEGEGVNLFPSLTPIAGLVKSDGEMGTTAGWQYVEKDVTEGILAGEPGVWIKDIKMRPTTVSNAGYWRWVETDPITSAIVHGPFSSGEELFVPFPSFPVTKFRVDVKGVTLIDDVSVVDPVSVYKDAFISYKKPPVWTKFLGIDFKSGPSNPKPSPTTSVSKNERLEYASNRKAIFSFTFDDINASDATVYATFKAKGMPASFGLKISNFTAAAKALYLSYWQEGFSMLNHSVDHIHMDVPGIDPVLINSEIVNAKKAIVETGIVCSGWITPYSILDPSYYAIVDRVMGYGFTTGINTVAQTPASHPQVYKDLYSTKTHPMRMARYSIEGNDVDGNSLQMIKDVIDFAIQEKLMINFYAHKLPSATITGGVSWLTPEKLDAILTYIKAKADNYECMILNTDDAVKTYYSQTYAEKFEY